MAIDTSFKEISKNLYNSSQFAESMAETFIEEGMSQKASQLALSLQLSLAILKDLNPTESKSLTLRNVMIEKMSAVLDRLQGFLLQQPPLIRSQSLE